MSPLLQEAPRAVLLAGGVLLGLYLANRALDYGAPHHFARKLAHLAGGVAYLLSPVLFSSYVWPVVLSVGFTGLLLGARFLRPSAFRGVGGSGRPGAVAEVNFPLAGTISLIVLWVWLGEPWLAVLPPMFLGFGDAITGIIRSALYDRETKAWQGTLAMGGTCLLLASLVEPFWIGALGALAATLAERLTPAKGYWDDNITLTLTATVMIASLKLYGGN